MRSFQFTDYINNRAVWSLFIDLSFCASDKADRFPGFMNHSFNQFL